MSKMKDLAIQLEEAEETLPNILKVVKNFWEYDQQQMAELASKPNLLFTKYYIAIDK